MNTTQTFEHIASHLDKLGRRAKDRVTGFQGVVTSVSFDLYGCVCAAVTPPAAEDPEMKKSRWMDIGRLEIELGEPVMERPNYLGSTQQAAGRQGSADKPDID
jgi:hypothetical protein